MVQISKNSWKVIAWMSSFVALLVGLFIKMSPLVGSKYGFFSLTDLIAPMAGVFGIGVVSVIAIVRSIAFGHCISLFLVPIHHLPSICGAAAWERSTLFFRVLLPATCMIAFSIHPIGQYAVPYTFYWVIPMGLYALRRNSIFETALASTFVTHAVGSVVWLYLKNLPVAVWWSLMPVVAFERLFSAIAMTVIYYGIYEVIAMAQMFCKTQLIGFKK